MIKNAAKATAPSVSIITIVMILFDIGASLYAIALSMQLLIAINSAASIVPTKSTIEMNKYFLFMSCEC